MERLFNIIKFYAAAENGAVAIEYALIASALSAAIIAGFPFVSSAVTVKLSAIGGYFSVF